MMSRRLREKVEAGDLVMVRVKGSFAPPKAYKVTEVASRGVFVGIPNKGGRFIHWSEIVGADEETGEAVVEESVHLKAVPLPKADTAPKAEPARRFSGWFSQWLDSQGEGTAALIAKELKVYDSVVSHWKNGKFAPTEDEQLAFAAFMEENYPDDSKDWLDRVQKMVAQDVAAGCNIRKPRGPNKATRERLAKAAYPEVPAEPEPPAPPEPEPPPEPPPKARPVPEPPRREEPVSAINLKINGLDVSGNASDLRALLGLR